MIKEVSAPEELTTIRKVHHESKARKNWKKLKGIDSHTLVKQGDPP